jgi:Uma2 family endonuclease
MLAVWIAGNKAPGPELVLPANGRHNNASRTTRGLMATITATPTIWAAVDLAKRFGPIPAHRIRSDPAPGTATEQDVIDIQNCEERLYELVDGILLEKVMGFGESILTVALIRFLGNFVARRKLGVVAGEAGMMRLAPGCVRLPDVSFISWGRLPDRKIPKEPIPNLVPDLAVEVLSEGNTIEEMELKLQEYFRCGVRLVWFVDPRARTVKIYTSARKFTVLHEHQTLDGGEVLPGFSLPLRKLFAELEPQAKKGRKPRDKNI